MGNNPPSQNGDAALNKDGRPKRGENTFFGMQGLQKKGLKSAEKVGRWMTVKGWQGSSSSTAPSYDPDEDDGEKYPCESLMSFIDENDLESPTSSDNEEECMEPVEFSRTRKNGVSAEATGFWNPRRAGKMPKLVEKSAEHRDALYKALKVCPLFKGVDDETLSILVDCMPIEEIDEGTKIIQQGDFGDSGYVVLQGTCYVCDEEGQNQIYARKEEEVSESITASEFGKMDKMVSLRPGEDAHGAARASRMRAETAPGQRRMATFGAGRFFGEIAMLWGAKRTVSIFAREDCVLAKLDREAYTNIVVLRSIAAREMRQECLRRVKLLETVNDEHMILLADALEIEIVEKGHEIIKQGTWGQEFYVVQSGECSATVRTVNDAFDDAGGSSDVADVQEHRRYGPGELFGERALLQRTYRAATVTALVPTQLLMLKRRSFERLIGPLDSLAAAHYLTDPRKNIADFYRAGDSMGPVGSRTFSSAETRRKSIFARTGGLTEWFAVYRPTSRDAISKMLSGDAVGKGLNVKGKSAKGGRLSGYVPFLQIHDNHHKQDLEESPPDARVKIFYANEASRDQAIRKLKEAIENLAEPSAAAIAAAHHHEPYRKAEDGIAKEEIIVLGDYGDVFGIEVLESAMRVEYIDKPDLTFLAGWETGRGSEPAFMDMNLHAVRGSLGIPEVVLYQVDKDNPMNPQGLLIAYAEAKVKPVVSDFDTFTVGSRGMIYEELPPIQCELASWCLDHTLGILKEVDNKSWNSRWLEVMKKDDKPACEAPFFGYADSNSYRLISEVVAATIESGAVRHGPECFNFNFPQEFDEEYLVVWEKFPDKPWNYLTAEKMRLFLLERVGEGYSFPLHPVWCVRDQGWYEVLEVLQTKVEATINLAKWLPQDAGLREKIEFIHKEYPDGFVRKDKKQLAAADNWKRAAGKKMTNVLKVTNMLDLNACERADFVQHQIKNPSMLKAASNLENIANLEDHL